MPTHPNYELKKALPSDKWTEGTKNICTIPPLMRQPLTERTSGSHRLRQDNGCKPGFAYWTLLILETIQTVVREAALGCNSRGLNAPFQQAEALCGTAVSLLFPVIAVDTYVGMIRFFRRFVKYFFRICSKRLNYSSLLPTLLFSHQNSFPAGNNKLLKKMVAYAKRL